MAGIFVCSYHAISAPVVASDIASVDASLNAVKHLLWYQNVFNFFENLCFEWKASDVGCRRHLLGWTICVCLFGTEHLVNKKKSFFFKFTIKKGVAKTRGSRWIEHTVPNCVLRLPSRNVRSKETCYSVIRDLLQCQKRPITVSKDTYYGVKRELLQRQTRPISVKRSLVGV